MILAIPPAFVVATVVAWIGWLGKTAAPAIYHHKIQVELQRYEAAKYLCDSKGDCSVLKAYAAKGLKLNDVKTEPVSNSLDQGDKRNGSNETKENPESSRNGTQSENGGGENSNN